MRFLYRTKEKKQNSSQTHSSVFQNLENIPLEIAVYDLAGNIIYLNPHFNTNGLDRNIFIGRDDLFYFHQTAFRPADPQKRKDSFQKAVESGRIIRFTETIKTSEGKKTLYFKRSFQSVYPYADNEKYRINCKFFLGGMGNLALCKSLTYPEQKEANIPYSSINCSECFNF